MIQARERLDAVESLDAVETDRICQSLRLWLVDNISEALAIDPVAMDTNLNLDDLGLDSLQAICIAGYLQEWLGFKIPETVLEDYPTIESACGYIMKLIPASHRQNCYAAAVHLLAERDSRPSQKPPRGHIVTTP